jgi:hypothetical protein
MVVVPNSLAGHADSPGWWVRSWDRTYKELEIADIKAPLDLEEVAEDVGAQLGSANTRQGSETDSGAVRKRELAITSSRSASGIWPNQEPWLRRSSNCCASRGSTRLRIRRDANPRSLTDSRASPVRSVFRR